jgi:serine/threonine-protein kinase
VALNHLTAVKFMQPGLARNRDAVIRFLNEAKAIAQLRNEHLVRVMDIGRHTNGLPFMVLEYLSGIDLADIMAREQPANVEVAVDYILQACEGLADAHAHGIVHRDLKPENLFITRAANGQPLLKLLDFGISKQLRERRVRSLTNPSQRIGSPDYMAPETMRKPNEVDQRADIWSLGIVLYELLSGRLPFAAPNIPAVCTRVLSDEPTALRWREEIPKELESVVLKCLQKDPNDRYPTVAHLATALAEFAPGGEEAASRVARVLWTETSSEPRSASRNSIPDAHRDGTLSRWSPTKRPLVAFIAGATAGATSIALLLGTDGRTPASFRTAVAMTTAPLLSWSGLSQGAYEPVGTQCNESRSASPVARWVPKIKEAGNKKDGPPAAHQAGTRAPNATTRSVDGDPSRLRDTRRE